MPASKENQYKYNHTLKAQVRRKRYYEKTKIKHCLQALKWYLENPKKRLLFAAKSRAKESNLEFNITLEDMIIPTLCPYLKIPLTNIQGSGIIDSNISLDRIDPSKGYIKGNIQIISNLANRMKTNATKEQLILFAKGILAQYEPSLSNTESLSRIYSLPEV
jgi:hypothetical protein